MICWVTLEWLYCSSFEVVGPSAGAGYTPTTDLNRVERGVLVAYLWQAATGADMIATYGAQARPVQ